MRALLEDCWDGRVVAMQRNLDWHKDHTHSRISFWTTEFALKWSWALGLCCWLWLQSVLPQHDIELFCPSSDILHIVSVSDELGPSSLVLEGWAILTALLLSGQTPVFLKPDMIVSGWIDLYQACENKELNWSFITTDPGLSSMYGTLMTNAA